ncbi:MAG TPA: hypothetical protein VFH95_08880 [Candidatus Kapabacteria bacterium]|nr:hypothetical protein [Candidatus Kapabacteria bacterium]
MVRYALIILLGAAASSALLASCCEPAHKNSAPYVVNSMFQEVYGRDIDLAHQQGSVPDSAYFPIYTFGIQNTGTDDDVFTLQLRANGGGFDITRRVPAGQVVLFRTPTAVLDSITSNEQFSYVITDTNPNIDEIYKWMSFQTTDSAEIHSLNPTLSIVYGAIDNGPEGCNTPASTTSESIDSLPKR